MIRVIIKGGVGSGHRGHQGRPGKRGGSLPGTGGYGIAYESIDNGEPHIDEGPKGWEAGYNDITRVDYNVLVPVDLLRDPETVDVVRIEGVASSRTQEFRDKLANRIGNEGLNEGITIAVEKYGRITIIDGTHRLEAVDRLDWTHIAVSELRYFGNSQRLGLIHTNTKHTKLVVSKGGPGSGHRGHRGRPGKRGGSLPGTGGGTGRVWQGEQHAKPEKKLSKLQTGAIGEELAMGALEEKLGAKFSTLNNGVNNAPIDVGGNHHAIEVKTGLASNGRTAQHWRATIGQPGKKETELIKKMSKEEKRAHHTWKKQKILERKNTALREMEKMAGTEIKPATIGVILSPDGKRGDVYFIPGFHLRLPWKDYATKEYHIGTYDI